MQVPFNTSQIEGSERRPGSTNHAQSFKASPIFQTLRKYTALYEIDMNPSPSLARELFCFAHTLRPLRGKESHDPSGSLQFGSSTNDVEILKESWSCYSSRNLSKFPLSLSFRCLRRRRTLKTQRGWVIFICGSRWHVLLWTRTRRCRHGCIIDDGMSTLGSVTNPFDLNALDNFRCCSNLHTGESLFLYNL